MSDTTVQRELPVEGMTCENCVRHVKHALEGVAGVASAQVDLASARATVEYKPATATLEAMAAAVKEAGYTLKVEG